MAATLMEIKSAMLLPRQELAADGTSAAAELADPRYELVQKASRVQALQGFRRDARAAAARA
jgi:chromatin segregation and condensation protein Rec8/ScpA/Scc1 (kleisin family)